MKVQKLGLDVRSKLESGLTITDATQCALELVENALDAKATAIAVRVNLSSYIIEVIDNGIGIPPDDLNLIGKRFMTSKCHSGDDLNKNLITYGYRGQALASLVDVCSKLSIKTKSKACKNTLVKIFKAGKTGSVYIDGKEKSSTGTTITVYDFMSTMPVRRKRISEVFDLQGIKMQLQYLALIHNEVCFTLKNESKGEILLQTHKRTDGRLLMADLFGVSVDKYIAPITYTDENIEIHGFVSLKKHSESSAQLFYVNKRIVFNSIIHKLLNSLIDKYLEENRKEFSEESSELQALHLNKPRCDYNVYVIQIHCPYSWFELYRNLRRTTAEFKNWDLIMSYLKKAVKMSLRMRTSTPDKENVHPAIKRKCLLPKTEAELKNGLQGAFVKRKEKLANNGETSKFINTHKLERNEHSSGLMRRRYDTMDLQSFENLRSSGFLREFSEWFEERIRNDVNFYKIYSEFIRDRCVRTSGLQISQKRRLSGGNGVRKRLKNSDIETDRLKRDGSLRLKQKSEVVDVKLKKRRNGHDRIKKDKAVVKQVKSSFTEVTESEISIQINTQTQLPGESSLLRRNKKISNNLHSPYQMTLIENNSFKEPANRQKSSRLMKKFLQCKDMQVQTSFMSDKYDKSIQVVSLGLSVTRGIDGDPSKLELEETAVEEPKASGGSTAQNDIPSNSDEIICGQTFPDASNPATSADSLPPASADLPASKHFQKSFSKQDELPDTLPARLCSTPFTCTERYSFIPNGLSQSGLNKSPTIIEDEIKSTGLLPESMFDELEEKARGNMVFCESELISCTLSKSAAKVNNILNSFTINKQILSDVKVVGQWDNKFIIAVIEISIPQQIKVLTLFDQHAADERIQLERILKESRRPDGTFVSCSCNPPIKCMLNESSVRFIPSLEDRLLRYGLKATIVDHQTVLLNEIPVCLVGENFRDDKTGPVLGSLINEIIKECNETRGASSVVPTVLHTAMSTRACKNAVKFNTVLSEDSMKKLMDDLMKCQNPFQCAHGRPCLAPMLDLEEFSIQEKTEKFSLHFNKFHKSSP